MAAIFFFFVVTPTHNVQADTVNGVDYSFDDGVNNWSKPTTSTSTSTFGFIPIGNGLELGYGFGLAQTANSTYPTNAGDSTITNSSVNSGSMNTSYSKMNVFLKNSSNLYIGSTFQGYATSTSDLTRASGVSMTSPDFLITPPNTFKTVQSDNSSILGGGNYQYGSHPSDVSGLHNKAYYTATVDGKSYFKIVGVLTRNNSTYGKYNLTIEILLRPSPTNSALVQREMYVRNTSSDPASFQTLFGEDTKLGPTNNSAGYSNDRVPIYDLGNKSGLYIKDSSYRLNITNETEDGFNNYVAIDRTTNSPNWAANYNTSTGAGDEVNSGTAPSTTPILSNPNDTTYSLKWNSVTLQQNQVAHFSSTIGEVQSPYALPTPSKTYTNETRNTGKNKVGDTLKFSLKMDNFGFNSSWAFNKLVDKLPTGLQYKPNSVSINGASYDSSKANFDSSTNTLTVNPGVSIADDKSSIVTFEATITNDASGKTLTNTGTFSGRDMNTSPIPSTDSDFNASVKIPVDSSNFGYSFIKQIKKDADTTYSTSIDESSPNIVDYKIEFSVINDSTHTNSLATGALLTDKLPDGLSLVDESVNYTADNSSYNISNGNSLDNINVGPVAAGKTVTLTFKAKINQSTAGQLINSATINGAKTSTGTSLGDITSTIATLNVQDSQAFLSVPNIDFGKVNMYGKEITLNNISTDGGLRIAHPNSNPYSVMVSYDNTNTDTQMKSGSNTLSNSNINSDGSGLLFIRQRTNSANNPGTFTAILPSGTPLQTSSFTQTGSNVDLSDYVGVGDWKIKLGANTEAGSYQGTLTWSMQDSI